MSATHDDEQSLKISKAIGRRCRPYTDRDIARATRGHSSIGEKLHVKGERRGMAKNPLL
ncbi:MAG: hypothetical protein JO284_19415 [Planctomycetaceae bacterium]|nr:hypothetical protein [Planctomycetaceae bacterium]MBV8264869.1 hypothetical protein [Planctomycetaceae bacterium]